MHKIFFNINYTISCYCCKETTKGSLQIHSGDKHLGNCTINIVHEIRLKSTFFKNNFSYTSKIRRLYFLNRRTFSAKKLFQKMSIFSPFPKFYFILILAHCDTSRSSFCLLVVVTKRKNIINSQEEYEI